MLEILKNTYKSLNFNMLNINSIIYGWNQNGGKI